MGGNSNDTLHLDFRRFSAQLSAAQPSPAQHSGYPHKLSYYGGLGGCSWWCRHLTGSTYLQYSTVQYSTTTVHPQVIVLPSLRWESLQISLFWDIIIQFFLYS